MKRIFIFFLCFLMIFPTAFAAEIDTIDAIEEQTASVLLKTVTNPQFGEVGGEWTIIGLARSGMETPEGYFGNYYSRVETLVKEMNGSLTTHKYTDYSRLVLALTAIGKDPRDVGGYNLLAPLADFEMVTYQGVNGAIWALLALDSNDYEMPVCEIPSHQASREMYLAMILDAQNADGGWSLSGGASEPDLTAMAISALVKYDEAQDAVERGILYLSKTQTPSGGYESWGEENAESALWVFIVLGELGISYEDERFVKNGNTILDFLMNFYHDGAFSHLAGMESDVMSTEQGLLALTALLRAEEGKPSLFDMSDATSLVGETNEGNNRHSDVKMSPVILEGKTFSDIKGHSVQKEMEDLASRKIINGKSETLFDPDATMTRAEFATIVVRALGLPTGGEEPFSDVNSNDWFTPYVASAYRYGIVNGVGEDRFNPSGTITREEAAVMVSRAAALCGMENTLSEAEIMDTLTLFTDYVEVSSWAREGMAFCYDTGILSDEAMEILPKEPVLRFEIAKMLWNLLMSAELI